MTCSGCGLMSCPGECFLQCEADFPPEVETPEVRKPYEPSPEYRAWLMSLPKKRNDGRWEVAA